MFGYKESQISALNLKNFNWPNLFSMVLGIHPDQKKS
jgi:hypothetical protein